MRPGGSVDPSPKRQRGDGRDDQQPARLRSGLGSITAHRVHIPPWRQPARTDSTAHDLSDDLELAIAEIAVPIDPEAVTAGGTRGDEPAAKVGQWTVAVG